MDHIVLIGNGFDLAHGLETSYMHFLNWYLKNIAKNIELYDSYDDALVSVSNNESFFRLNDLKDNTYELFNILRKKSFTVKFKSDFSSKLLGRIHDSNWVDIENLYYNCLINICERGSSNIEIIDKNHVIKLNNSFLFIKKKLVDYLNTLNFSKIENKSNIEAHLDKLFASLNDSDIVLFLNFNYTVLINNYLKFYPSDKILINNIHGQLNNELNQIIFGYGDETDEFYERIEKLNDNDFLSFFKSFGYSFNDNYKKLISFLSHNKYKVHILGHSCGLSDKVLLKEVFENDCCEEIIIYYYQSDEKTNDYINKYMDISRHFSHQNKGKMRVRIKDFENSKPLVNYIKK